MLKRFIIAVLLLAQIAAPTSYALVDSTSSERVVVPPVSAPAVLLPASPILITSYMVDTLPLYLQLYNTTSDIVSLDGYQINYDLLSADNVELPVQASLAGYIEPHGYIVIARQDIMPSADLNLPTDSLITDGTVENLVLHNDNYADDTRSMVLTGGVRYDLSQSDAGNYTKTSKYIVTDTAVPLIGRGYYTFATSTPLRVAEFMPSAADCAPLDTSISCRDFVKIINNSDEDIDLSGYRVRLGYGNQSAGISNSVHLTGILAAHNVAAISQRDDGQSLDLTATAGNIWLEDYYGLQIYEDTIVGYNGLDSTTHKGQSRVLTSGDWQWALPVADGISPIVETAESDNPVEPTNSTLKPCAPNQYRSPETNRCRLIATTVSAVDKPCPDGQYRSTETNRCRSLTATLAAAPRPCADNQYRNPDTGRCKLLASETDNSLKPCAAGQERNPDTNRCRKVVATIPLADYPTATKTAAGIQKTFSGWYALGIVLLLGFGYALWEWRQEIGGFARRVATMISRHD